MNALFNQKAKLILKIIGFNLQRPKHPRDQSITIKIQ